MKTKLIPTFIMLLAGAITSIITYFLHYESRSALTILLLVLVVFYIVGLLVKKVLDSFEKTNAEEISDEGKVIEKEVESEDENATDEK